MTIKAGGYGFVEFEDEKDAEDASKAMHGVEIHGQKITVQFSRDPRAPRGSGPPPGKPARALCLFCFFHVV